MSATPDPGGARPARLVGLVLMGIAVIAVILGVITLVNGDGDNGTATSPPPPPPTSSEATQPPEEQPSPGQPSSSNPPPATSAPPPPATTTAAPPPPPNPRAVPVRVYNNGTVGGLAREAAGHFRADGWNVTEVGNYSQGIIPTSTVYFRPQTEEEAAARALGQKFSLRVQPRFQGIVNTPPGLIVLLANDYGGK